MLSLSHFISDSHVTPGWLLLAALGVAVLSYFLGGFNGAVAVSRYILRDDIRGHGSGNAGLTNFLRTFGGPLTFLVIAADVLKAVLSIAFGMFIASMLSPALIPVAKYWAGLFCLLGHMFPATFGFKGGKGILSGGIMALMIDWRVALVVWGGFILLAVLTRYVSLGSCWAGASFPFVSWFVYRDWLILILSAIIGGLILWKHRGNIDRLIHGTESKFSIHKNAPAAPSAPKGDAVPAPSSAPGAAKAPSVPAPSEKEKNNAERPQKKSKPAPADTAGPKPEKRSKERAGTFVKEPSDTDAFVAAPSPDGPWLSIDDLPYGGWSPADLPEAPSKPVKQIPPPGKDGAENRPRKQSPGKKPSGKGRRK